MLLLSWLYFGDLRSYPFDGDDDTYLRDSAQISEDFSALLFPSRYPGRPLVNLVFWLGYELWGESPGAFHLLVVGAHVVVSLLLARLVMGLGGSRELGFLSGLLFLVNVAHFRAIQWISAIAYPLMFALGIAAILCCLRYMTSRQPGYLAATYGGLLLAVLAHQAAIAIWAFALHLCWNRERRLCGPLLHLLPLGGLLLLVIAGVVYLYPAAPPVAVAARLPSPLELAQNVLWFLGRLFTAAYWIIWPIYRYAAWELWAGAAALVALVLLFFRGPPLAAPWTAWTLISLVPFITPSPAVLRDLPQGGPSRFLYLSSAGTALLASWGLLAAGRWLQGRLGLPWARALGAAVLLGLLVSSFFALRRAQNFTLYTAGRNSLATGSPLGIGQLQRAVATQDSLIVPLEDAYVRLCLHLLGTEEAAACLEEALRQFPANATLNAFSLVSLSLGSDEAGRAEAALRLQTLLQPIGDHQDQSLRLVIAQSYGIMALNLSRRGDLSDAVAGYQKALALDPADPVTWANLGTTLKQLGRLPEAIQAYTQAIQRRADDPVLYHNLGTAAQEQGDRQVGIRAFERAAILGSANIETYLGLSQLYQENGQLDQALRVYDQILERNLKGATGALYAKMGTDLFHLGRIDASIRAYHKAIGKNPADMVTHVNLGWDLYLKGQVEEAIDHYQKALALQPSSQAQFNLGLAYLRLGQVQLARKTYEEGNQRYGADEARRIGAVDDLKQLVEQGVQVTEAKTLLNNYWK
jgi:tetratricopeptide (TPR) repeat protein